MYNPFRSNAVVPEYPKKKVIKKKFVLPPIVYVLLCTLSLCSVGGITQCLIKLVPGCVELSTLFTSIGMIVLAVFFGIKGFSKIMK